MLDPLYHLAANAIVFFHRGFGPIFGADSFFAWALSVVLLVICVRILIFPLFVKQVKSQRTMQMMQPRIKEIKEKYGHDKQQMQAEIMKLQKEHGNPLLGCLPILLQIPLFISLFHVFTHLAPMNEGPGGSLVWRPRVGLSADQVEQIASAKLWGISLSNSFGSSQDLLDFLGANGTHAKILAVVLIVLMGATTFFTQRQIMARTGPVDPQQAMVQKILLYGSPLMLAIFGFRFPIAVLLYWLTTNLWSMGQQFFVIKKMPPIKPLAANGKVPGARTAPSDGAAVSRPSPGARAGAKSKSRPRPATTSLTKGADSGAGGQAAGENGRASSGSAVAVGSGERVSSAPPGTRSRSGTSTSKPKTPAKAAGAKATPKGTPQSTPKATAVDAAGGAGKASATSEIADSGREAATGSATAAAGTSRSNGVAESEGASRSTPPPVPAGMRRAPGGSRPAKRRGKGKRPGGRR
ncbi:membrane protein insertase YidC [Parafrankia discariae]|uniref:membrane protein insertase YidC n=1 Tax=Parafrankia discariae TaxID=365528 RepID=UPI00036BD95D|nr:membrane protein insertase YidC [Parafrankia discariae]